MADAVIVSTARTPIGKAYRGAFNATPSPTLAAHPIRAAVERAKIDPAEIDDVIMGAALQQGVQTTIGRTVVEGNDKLLFVLLSSLTYFVAKVHFLRDDPFADPTYVPYSRLLAAHFMNAAVQCLPGPDSPSEEIRRANAARLAAETSQASMALVEALGIVGSSAIESAASSGA